MYYLKHEYDERDSGLLFSIFIGAIIIAQFLVTMIFQPFYSPQDNTAPQWALWIMQGLLYVILLGVVIFYHRKLKINFVRANGLDKKFTPVDIIMSIVFGVGMMFTFLIFTFLFSYLLQEVGYKGTDGFPGIDSAGTFILAIIIICIFPAVVEEVVFRGAVLSGFTKIFHIALAAVFSALFFMLMHMNPAQIINPILTGVVMAVMVNKTKTVKVSMIAHFINNFIIVLLSYIESFMEPQADAGGALELKDITQYLIFFAVGIVLLAGAIFYFFSTRKNGNFKAVKIDRNVFEDEEMVVESENTGTDGIVKQRRKRAFLYSLPGIIAAVVFIILDIVLQ